MATPGVWWKRIGKDFTHRRMGLHWPATRHWGYTKIKKFIADNQNVGKTVFNGTVVTDYCYAGTTWIGYDDEQSISRKVSYAKNRGLLGYFGWHAGADSDMILSGQG